MILIWLKWLFDWKETSNPSFFILIHLFQKVFLSFFSPKKFLQSFASADKIEFQTDHAAVVAVAVIAVVVADAAGVVVAVGDASAAEFDQKSCSLDKNGQEINFHIKFSK